LSISHRRGAGQAKGQRRDAHISYPETRNRVRRLSTAGVPTPSVGYVGH
jgi:hypothetical protein